MTMTSDKKEEVAKGRGTWDNHFEFFLSSLGLAVGLGNIWRFPYIAYQNGGATFMVPYLFMLTTVGLPIFLLELTIGQYGGLSSTKIFAKLAPGLKGLGFGMVLQTAMITVYYVIIMAHAIFYLINGLTVGELPWASCVHDFNSDHCFTQNHADSCKTDQTFFMKRCMDGNEFCDIFDLTFVDGMCQDGDTRLPFEDVTYRVSPTEDFYYRNMLHLNVEKQYVNNSEGQLELLPILDTTKNSWSNFGAPRLELAGCLLLCWVLVCLSLIKGIQSYGKVVYFTTLFPYVVLTILLIYAATLDGFVEGISFYLVPKDIEKLLDIRVWSAAASQIFYSLGVGLGNQLLLSSFNDFRSNVFRDALMIGLGNSLTSIYAGTVVFGILGYMANIKGVGLADVVATGPGLAFIVYPEAVSLMSFAPYLFSFLFFFMLCLLAISSVCGMWETVISAFCDQFKAAQEHRGLTVIISCSVAFILGLPMIFESGYLLLDLMDSRSANSILLLAFLELICLSWFYGADKVIDHLRDMEVNMPACFRAYFKLCWSTVAPVVIIVVSFLSYSTIKSQSLYGYEYPWALQIFAWIVETLSIIVTLCFTIQEALKRAGKGDDLAFFKVGPMLRPTHKWGARPDSGLVGVDDRSHGLDNQIFHMVEKEA